MVVPENELLPSFDETCRLLSSRVLETLIMGHEDIKKGLKMLIFRFIPKLLLKFQTTIIKET